MLGRWVKEQQSDEGQAFRRNGKLTPARLVHAEQSGFTDLGRAEILAEAKEAASRNGDLQADG